MTKQSTNNDQLTISQRSWAFSFLLHGLILCLSLFITCSPTIPEEDLVEIQFGGGGGIPGLDAPIGETPKGNPDGGNNKVEEESAQTESSTESDQVKVEPTEQRADPVTSQDVIPAESTTETTTNPTNTTPTDKTEESSEDGGAVGTNNSSEAQGTNTGSGTKPTGGSGGGTIGVGGGKLGGGRCWQVSPARATGTAARVRGSVTVTLTITWDGRVRVTGVSGGGALATQARSLASRAKACPIEPGSPAQTTTITYTVK